MKIIEAAPQSNAGVSEEEIEKMAISILDKHVEKKWLMTTQAYQFEEEKVIAAMVEMYQSTSKPKDNELLEAREEDYCNRCGGPCKRKGSICDDED